MQGFAAGDTNFYRWEGNNCVLRSDPFGLASETLGVGKTIKDENVKWSINYTMVVDFDSRKQEAALSDYRYPTSVTYKLVTVHGVEACAGMSEGGGVAVLAA